MKTQNWIAAALLLLLGSSPVLAGGIPRPFELGRVNRRLKGHVDDYTSRHHGDRRMWSEALQQNRDMYVYLPPCYDPNKQYPLLIWLHGFSQDEHAFLTYVVEELDESMAGGKLPPAIVVAPDGSIDGRGCFFSAGSFYLNTKAGRFEDYVMEDVWNYIHKHYPIRPEPEAHAIVGVSMGGGAAFNLSLKHRARVKVVVGFFPPLNTRWVDCHGRYMGNFDPNCWGWRTDTSAGHQVVGRFYGVVTVRLRTILDPLYDRSDPGTLAEISRENPIEMLERLNVKEGELAMHVAYGGRDEFNMDAQIESFLYVARARGLTVSVGYLPRGHHDALTARRLYPGVRDFLADKLGPYAP